VTLHYPYVYIGDIEQTVHRYFIKFYPDKLYMMLMFVTGVPSGLGWM
jgi:hypothetical protein